MRNDFDIKTFSHRDEVGASLTANVTIKIPSSYIIINIDTDDNTS